MPGKYIYVAAFMLLLVSSFDAFAMRCEGVDAQVVTPSAKLSSSICEIAKKTAAFMQEIGFETKFPLHITVSNKLKSLHLAPVYGLYNSHENRIEIIDLASHLSEHHTKKPFGIDMTRELHNSFIVHEISHAYAHANAPKVGLSLVAHEYIAYIVQFSLLPSAMLRNILENHQVSAFESENEISALYFHLNPEYFAVKSWRHYSIPGNGRLFIDAILRGEKLTIKND